MTYETILELTGYFASILILVSLLMSSAVKLRVINAVGAAVFTVYGILIQSYPTAFLNGVSVIVDIYYLVKLLRCSIHLAAHTVGHEERGLQEFLHFYRNDIGHYFPHFDFQINGEDQVIMVFADANPVSLFIAAPQPEGRLHVRLDYSIPRYRDCSIGKFLYEELALAGIRELTVSEFTPDHEVYLKKVGFLPSGDIYVKKLR